MASIICMSHCSEASGSPAPGSAAATAPPASPFARSTECFCRSRARPMTRFWAAPTSDRAARILRAKPRAGAVTVARPTARFVLTMRPPARRMARSAAVNDECFAYSTT